DPTAGKDQAASGGEMRANDTLRISLYRSQPRRIHTHHVEIRRAQRKQVPVEKVGGIYPIKAVGTAAVGGIDTVVVDREAAFIGTDTGFPPAGGHGCRIARHRFNVQDRVALISPGKVNIPVKGIETINACAWLRLENGVGAIVGQVDVE